MWGTRTDKLEDPKLGVEGLNANGPRVRSCDLHPLEGVTGS